MFVDPKWIRYATVLSSTVMVKALIIVAFLWAGRELDERFHTSPILMFVGLVVGTSLGFVWLFFNVKRLKPKDD